MPKLRKLSAILGLGILSGIWTTCVFFILLFTKRHDWGVRNEDSKNDSNSKVILFWNNEEAVDTPHNYDTNESTIHDFGLNQTGSYPYMQIGETVAREFANNIGVLCWIATIPKNHLTKAAVIRDTWGKRCNILLFMSSVEDPTLPSVKLNISEGRNNLFRKTVEAMKYVYKHYLNKVDWILKADDDTFVVVENLRYLLSKFDPSDALYLGRRFRPFTKQGFMSGGAGYVLSKTALRILVDEGFGENGKCLKMKSKENGEDVLLGRCVESVNVTAVDSRDDHGRGRFFPYGPDFHLFPDHASPVYEWYWKYQYYPNPEGLDCCSDTAVSFHYIGPKQLRTLDYLIYTLHPYGTSLYSKNTPSITISV